MEISGNSFKDEQFENIPEILLTFFIFHFEISDKDSKEEQSENK